MARPTLRQYAPRASVFRGLTAKSGPPASRRPARRCPSRGPGAAGCTAIPVTSPR